MPLTKLGTAEESYTIWCTVLFWFFSSFLPFFLFVFRSDPQEVARALYRNPFWQLVIIRWSQQMKLNCHVTWELELCDCGSVNNKLFKNIALGFIALWKNSRVLWCEIYFSSTLYVRDCCVETDSRLSQSPSSNRRKWSAGKGANHDATFTSQGRDSTAKRKLAHASHAQRRALIGSRYEWGGSSRHLPCKLQLKFQC